MKETEEMENEEKERRFRDIQTPCVPGRIYYRNEFIQIITNNTLINFFRHCP